jgi:hypothetical protein
MSCAHISPDDEDDMVVFREIPVTCVLDWNTR